MFWYFIYKVHTCCLVHYLFISLKQRHFHLLFDLDGVKLQKFFEFFSCTITIFHENTRKLVIRALYIYLSFLSCSSRKFFLSQVIVYIQPNCWHGLFLVRQSSFHFVVMVLYTVSLDYVLCML